MADPVTDARDVIAAAVAENHERGIRPTVDAVLAALAGLSITATPDTWEWGARWFEREVGTDYEGPKEQAESWARMNGPAVVVRRRPAGPWEAVSDVQ